MASQPENTFPPCLSAWKYFKSNPFRSQCRWFSACPALSPPFAGGQRNLRSAGWPGAISQDAAVFGVLQPGTGFRTRSVERTPGLLLILAERFGVPVVHHRNDGPVVGAYRSRRGGEDGKPDRCALHRERRLHAEALHQSFVSLDDPGVYPLDLLLPERHP